MGRRSARSLRVFFFPPDFLVSFLGALALLPAGPAWRDAWAVQGGCRCLCRFWFGCFFVVRM
eukprot:m.476484 g.476484  ORF g.476484 m.476484 type:complete len:62 (-) comp20544_c0_seq1:154-339(-)